MRAACSELWELMECMHSLDDYEEASNDEVVEFRVVSGNEILNLGVPGWHRDVEILGVK